MSTGAREEVAFLPSQAKRGSGSLEGGKRGGLSYDDVQKPAGFRIISKKKKGEKAPDLLGRSPPVSERGTNLPPERVEGRPSAGGGEKEFFGSGLQEKGKNEGGLFADSRWKEGLRPLEEARKGGEFSPARGKGACPRKGYAAACEKGGERVLDEKKKKLGRALSYHEEGSRWFIPAGHVRTVERIGGKKGRRGGWSTYDSKGSEMGRRKRTGFTRKVMLGKKGVPAGRGEKRNRCEHCAVKDRKGGKKHNELGRVSKKRKGVTGCHG